MRTKKKHVAQKTARPQKALSCLRRRRDGGPGEREIPECFREEGACVLCGNANGVFASNKEGQKDLVEEIGSWKRLKDAKAVHDTEGAGNLQEKLKESNKEELALLSEGRATR